MKSLALLILSALLTPVLAAQCENCPNNKAKTKVATSKTSAGSKLPLLYNDTCPVTGKTTGAKSPMIAFAGFQVSLCCNGCPALFAKLGKNKKRAFLASLTGKLRRTAFAKPGAGQANGTKKTECCEQAKVATKIECCEQAKATKNAECCEQAKAAKKAECCEQAKATKKAECCDQAKAAKKGECCPHAKTAKKGATCPHAKAAKK